MADVCRQLGVSEASFYLWKKKYAKMGLTEIRGGPTFSDTGISGFLSGHDRREVHAKAET